MEEESSAIPTSDLFHFTAHIEGGHAAITIDNCSLMNFVSGELVEELGLFNYRHVRPYMLYTYDDALPITQIACVPLTIYGHTVLITCHVIPRTLKCCHLLFGNKWCNDFHFDFDSYHPYLQFIWNNRTDWLTPTRLKKILEVRRQALCSPEISKIQLDKRIVMGLVVNKTCEVAPNVIISTPSVVPSDKIGRAHV